MIFVATIGTALELSFAVENHQGEPVEPTEYAAWAHNPRTGTSIDLGAYVDDGTLRADFSSELYGEWIIGLRVTAPVHVTARATGKLLELPPVP